MSATEDRLRECLERDDFPWAVLLRGDDERAVLVADFLRFAGECGVTVGERELDAFVERAGGRRTELVDPWSAPGRWVRRLLGRESEASKVYLIP